MKYRIAAIRGRNSIFGPGKAYLKDGEGNVLEWEHEESAELEATRLNERLTTKNVTYSVEPFE